MLAKVEQFIRERKYLANISPATEQWHQYSLCWLPSENPSADELKKTVVRMREKGLKATGCNSAIRSINAYLHWLNSPTSACGPGCQHLKVQKLKEEHRTLPTFKDEDIKTFIAWRPRGRTQQRMYALVLTLIDTGARIDEVLSLSWEDVDFDNLLVTYHGKGRKDRTVPISLELRKVLFRWKSKDNGRVFTTYGGTKLGRRNVLRDVKARCRALGFEPPPRTLHAFRHSFAVAYVRNGGGVFHLQRVLGHSTLEMTKRYVNLQTADLQKIHAQCSLLSNARRA